MPQKQRRNRRRLLETLGATGLCSIAGCVDLSNGDDDDTDPGGEDNGEENGTEEWVDIECDPPSPASWTSLGGTNKNAWTGGADVAPDPAIAWKTELDVRKITGGVVASEEAVYVCTSDGGIGGHDLQGSVTALDRDSGEILWQFEVPHFFRTTPTLHEGAIFAVSGGGRLHALDQTTGDELWSTNVGTWGEDADPSALSRLFHGTSISDGIAIVPLPSGTVSGVNAADGTIEWEYNFPGESIAAPAIHEETAYISSRSGVAAIDFSGEQQWWVSEVDARPAPSLHGDTVYVGASPAALSADDGSLLWQEHVGASFPTSVASCGGAVLIGGSFAIAGERGTGELAAFDAETGGVGWRIDSDEFPGWSESVHQPVIGNQYAYVGLQHGYLFAVELETGRIEWDLLLPADEVSARCLVDGELFVITEVLWGGGDPYVFKIS